MKKLILFLALLVLPGTAWAMPATYGVGVAEVGGSSVDAYRIVFPSGTMTCVAGVCTYAAAGTFTTVTIGTTLQFRVSGGVPQYSIDSGTTWYAMQGDSSPVISSTATGTGNINIDGVSASHYRYSNGASAATYTPVITSAPPASTERYVLLTVGGGAGVCTMTWTNVTWLGTAGAAATTTNKKSTYACIIPESGNAQCKIVAEAY